MAGKVAAVAAATAAKTVVKAVGEYQYPWREKLAKYKDELSKGVWGYWELGAWKPLSFSARQRARLRKEVLLAGEEWPYDPSRKEMRTKRKGHKCDRVSAEKLALTTVFATVAAATAAAFPAMPSLSPVRLPPMPSGILQTLHEERPK
ncbi:hypothetical protein Taro_041924, partial [Colocasia esculenta]|nr:hypothetical protein [Colocasia esculenta]